MTKAKHDEHNNIVHCTGALGHERELLKGFITRSTLVDINSGTN